MTSTPKRKSPIYRNPPTTRDNIVCPSFRFRYVQSLTTLVPISISSAELQRLFLVNAVTGTLFSQLIGSFRIRSIEVWRRAPAAPTGNSDENTVSIKWLGGGLSSDVTVKQTSLSSSTPPYLRTVPPRNSQASFWSGSNSNDYFSIPYSYEGDVLDIVVDLSFDLGILTTTTASGAAGPYLIYGKLDGVGGTWIATTTPGAAEL